MGAVKEAVMEVQDAVAGCIEDGKTLEETWAFCKRLFYENEKSNSYLTDEGYIRHIYYEWRGGEL